MSQHLLFPDPKYTWFPKIPPSVAHPLKEIKHTFFGHKTHFVANRIYEKQKDEREQIKYHKKINIFMREEGIFNYFYYKTKTENKMDYQHAIHTYTHTYFTLF